MDFPKYDKFEKETGQADGFEFAKHKLYQGDKLVTEMIYFFNFVDYIPNKWPAKVVIIDYTDKLQNIETKI